MQILLLIILYKVTDSHSDPTTKTITITVNPKIGEVKPEYTKAQVESKPEADKKPTDNNTIPNTTNKLLQTGDTSSSLPSVGVLSIAFGTTLSVKKKKNNNLFIILYAKGEFIKWKKEK